MDKPRARPVIRPFVWVVLFSLGALAWFAGSLLVVREVVVLGDTRLTASDVMAVTGLQPGNKLWEVSLKEARRALEALPQVKEATLRWQLGGQLLVNITERRAVAAIPAEGSFLIVDYEGRILQLSQEPVSNLPLVTGLELDSRLPGKFVSDPAASVVLQVCFLLDEEARYVSEVHWDGELTLYTIDGVPVYLGVPDQGLRDRVSALRGILVDLSARNLRPRYVNFRHTGRPVIGLD